MPDDNKIPLDKNGLPSEYPLGRGYILVRNTDQPDLPNRPDLYSVKYNNSYVLTPDELGTARSLLEAHHIRLTTPSPRNGGYAMWVETAQVKAEYLRRLHDPVNGNPYVVYKGQAVLAAQDDLFIPGERVAGAPVYRIDKIEEGYRFTLANPAEARADVKQSFLLTKGERVMVPGVGYGSAIVEYPDNTGIKKLLIHNNSSFYPSQVMRNGAYTTLDGVDGIISKAVNNERTGSDGLVKAALKGTFNGAVKAPGAIIDGAKEVKGGIAGAKDALKNAASYAKDMSLAEVVADTKLKAGQLVNSPLGQKVQDATKNATAAIIGESATSDRLVLDALSDPKKVIFKGEEVYLNMNSMTDGERRALLPRIHQLLDNPEIRNTTTKDVLYVSDPESIIKHHLQGLAQGQVFEPAAPGLVGRIKDSANRAKDNLAQRSVQETFNAGKERALQLKDQIQNSSIVQNASDKVSEQVDRLRAPAPDLPVNPPPQISEQVAPASSSVTQAPKELPPTPQVSPAVTPPAEQTPRVVANHRFTKLPEGAPEGSIAIEIDMHPGASPIAKARLLTKIDSEIPQSEEFISQGTQGDRVKVIISGTDAEIDAKHAQLENILGKQRSPIADKGQGNLHAGRYDVNWEAPKQPESRIYRGNPNEIAGLTSEQKVALEEYQKARDVLQAKNSPNMRAEIPNGFTKPPVAQDLTPLWKTERGEYFVDKKFEVHFKDASGSWFVEKDGKLFTTEELQRESLKGSSVSDRWNGTAQPWNRGDALPEGYKPMSGAVNLDDLSRARQNHGAPPTASFITDAQKIGLVDGSDFHLDPRKSSVTMTESGVAKLNAHTETVKATVVQETTDKIKPSSGETAEKSAVSSVIPAVKEVDAGGVTVREFAGSKTLETAETFVSKGGVVKTLKNAADLLNNSQAEQAIANSRVGTVTTQLSEKLTIYAAPVVDGLKSAGTTASNFVSNTAEQLAATRAGQLLKTTGVTIAESKAGMLLANAGKTALPQLFGTALPVVFAIPAVFAARAEADKLRATDTPIKNFLTLAGTDVERLNDYYKQKIGTEGTSAAASAALIHPLTAIPALVVSGAMGGKQMLIDPLVGNTDPVQKLVAAKAVLDDPAATREDKIKQLLDGKDGVNNSLNRQTNYRFAVSDNPNVLNQLFDMQEKGYDITKPDGRVEKRYLNNAQILAMMMNEKNVEYLKMDRSQYGINTAYLTIPDPDLANGYLAEMQSGGSFKMSTPSLDTGEIAQMTDEQKQALKDNLLAGSKDAIAKALSSAVYKENNYGDKGKNETRAIGTIEENYDTGIIGMGEIRRAVGGTFTDEKLRTEDQLKGQQFVEKMSEEGAKRYEAAVTDLLSGKDDAQAFSNRIRDLNQFIFQDTNYSGLMLIKPSVSGGEVKIEEVEISKAENALGKSNKEIAALGRTAFQPQNAIDVPDGHFVAALRKTHAAGSHSLQNGV